MSERTSVGDISALLYLVPFAAAAIYAIVLWVQNGLSLELPSTVYLTVTRDPSLFIIGSLAFLLGVTMEIRSTEPDRRWAKLLSLSNTVQSVALASLVLVLICAVYANGLDLGGAASDFVVGRYGIVFPALLFLLSYLMRVKFELSAIRSTKFLGIVSMILVPGALYALGKLKTTADIPVALVFLVIGLFLFLWPEKKSSKPEGA
jgi:hypothetical protein